MFLDYGNIGRYMKQLHYEIQRSFVHFVDIEHSMIHTDLEEAIIFQKVFSKAIYL